MHNNTFHQISAILNNKTPITFNEKPQNKLKHFKHTIKHIHMQYIFHKLYIIGVKKTFQQNSNVCLKMFTEFGNQVMQSQQQLFICMEIVQLTKCRNHNLHNLHNLHNPK